MNYTDPLQTHYFYRLKGFDRKWQNSDASRRFAHYNNLAPGNYTFEVYASNGGIATDNPVRTLQILILPPPWKSWWAWMLYIFGWEGSSGSPSWWSVTGCVSGMHYVSKSWKRLRPTN
ncbi:MAG: hypothetical protein LUE93_14120 [Bacteroides sp.]|nr:hypothetical protein [Bacteroides sp.]